MPRLGSPFRKSSGKRKLLPSVLLSSNSGARSVTTSPRAAEIRPPIRLHFDQSLAWVTVPTSLHLLPHAPNAGAPSVPHLLASERSRLHTSVYALILVSLSLPLSAQSTRPPRDKPVSQQEIDSITHDAILIDTHDDVPSKTVDGYNITQPNKSGQTDLPRMKGFLGAEFFAVFVDADYVKGNHSANRTLQMIDTVRTDIIAAHPDDFVFATTADDVIRAHQQGKIAALMGIEGGHAIEDSLRLLRDYYALGIRYMTLTHFNTNNWADAQGDFEDSKVHHHNGLTPFGKDVVREMNRLGMMVDISHVADKTFYDALETSSAPIIASHSGTRAISNHTRNMTDPMIRALASKGGTVQINFDCGYLSQRYNDASKPLMAALRPRIKEAMKIPDPKAREVAVDKLEAEVNAKIPPATLADVVTQIDHAVDDRRRRPRRHRHRLRRRRLRPCRPWLLRQVPQPHPRPA